jgi:hypothetical protein
MPKLPVLYIILKSFSFFAQHLVKLIYWQLPPLGVSLAAAGAGFLGYRLTGHWLPAVPCLVLSIMAWVPFLIQVNQLAVLDQAQTGHYLARIFEAQSLRFLAYAVLVQIISSLGLIIAFVPAGLAGLNGGFTEFTPRLGMGLLVSVVLAVGFMILVSPLKLVYPCAAVEAQPSLGKAYNLGAENKFRLFLTWLLPGIFFFVLSSMLDRLANVFGPGYSLPKLVIILPAQLTLLTVNLMVNLVIPALAYRFLAGLPEPGIQPRSQADTPSSED